MVWHRIRYYSL